MAQQEKETILTTSQQKEQELTEKLKQWERSFRDKELEEVKQEWANLQQRPDITISEEQFYNGYARRLTLSASKLEKEDLSHIKTELAEYKVKNQQLWQAIGRILSGLIIQRYDLAEPVLTVEQARQAIARLLEETEQKWQTYLEGQEEHSGLRNLALDLSLGFQPEKREQVYKILEWIRETRTSGDYQTLFELWSGGKEYSREYDFDGSLFLLGKRLEVKDEDSETQITSA